eukprot:COSAG01_NODE_667_length_14389_cov_5.828202_16_plen_112_part_00
MPVQNSGPSVRGARRWWVRVGQDWAALGGDFGTRPCSCKHKAARLRQNVRTFISTFDEAFVNMSQQQEGHEEGHTHLAGFLSQNERTLLVSSCLLFALRVLVILRKIHHTR